VTDPNVISIGDDFRDFSPEHWGTRDRAQAQAEDRARAALEASKPPARDFRPLPGPPVTLSVNPFGPAPPSSADDRRLGLTPRLDLDGRLAKLGIRPRRKR
jgi:hypothetical protein